jgi:hypothetical protein
MDPLPRTKVDVTKITGPYALLGLFLLITEGLLGFWFFRAGDKMERMVVGGFMTLIFVLFLYVVMRIATKVEQAGSAQPVPRRRWPTVIATVAVLAFIGLLSEEFDTSSDSTYPIFPRGRDPACVPSCAHSKLIPRFTAGDSGSQRRGAE